PPAGRRGLGGIAIDTGTADLTLDSGAQLSTTAALSGENVTLRGDGGIVLGADVAATGSLSLSSQDAAITQTAGAVTAGGGANVDAGTGSVALTAAGEGLSGRGGLAGA